MISARCVPCGTVHAGAAATCPQLSTGCATTSAAPSAASTWPAWPWHSVMRLVRSHAGCTAARGATAGRRRKQTVKKCGLCSACHCGRWYTCWERSATRRRLTCSRYAWIQSNSSHCHASSRCQHVYRCRRADYIACCACRTCAIESVCSRLCLRGLQQPKSCIESDGILGLLRC